MKRGFSASTVILVALLLGVLFWVGKVVNPPVKGGHDDHDEERPASTQATTPTKPAAPTPIAASGKPTAPPTSGGSLGDPRMAAMPRKAPGAHPPAPKPDGMDAAYWQEHDMGAVKAKPDAGAH